MKAAKNTKIKLLNGREAILKVDEHSKRQLYPKEVEQIALNHWLENTILEPANKKRKVIEDGDDIVPKRYQDRTDKEMYINFQEECNESVKRAMERKKIMVLAKLESRPDNEYKEQRMQYAEKLTDKFPGIAWYIGLKPLEIVPLCDHTTGLCKDCESVKLNHSALRCPHE